MSTLHTVNKSPFEKCALDSCLGVAQPGSALLLTEDGVYAALRGTKIEQRVRDAIEGLSIYVLVPDLAARGMEESRLIERIGVVDYAGFVDLVEAHDKVHAWL